MAGSPETLRLDISGMSCGHCVMHVKKALGGVPGVEIVEVAIGLADVRVVDRAAALPACSRALADAGYGLVGPSV